MIIDDKLLEKLEKLSAFKVPDEKKESFKKELEEFVNFADILNELDLNEVSESFGSLNGATPFREDEPAGNKEVIDIILKHAPSSENGYFVVPKIIE